MSSSLIHIAVFAICLLGTSKASVHLLSMFPSVPKYVWSRRAAPDDAPRLIMDAYLNLEWPIVRFCVISLSCPFVVTRHCHHFSQHTCTNWAGDKIVCGDDQYCFGPGTNQTQCVKNGFVAGMPPALH